MCFDLPPFSYNKCCWLHVFTVRYRLCVSSFNTGLHVLQMSFNTDGDVSLQEIIQYWLFIDNYIVAKVIDIDILFQILVMILIS